MLRKIKEFFRGNKSIEVDRSYLIFSNDGMSIDPAALYLYGHKFPNYGQYKNSVNGNFFLSEGESTKFPKSKDLPVILQVDKKMIVGLESNGITYKYRTHI